MLTDDNDRYIAERQSLGFSFRVPAYVLRRFGRFAQARGDSVVRTQTVIEWAAEAPSAPQRRGRLLVVRRFALHMQAEDERYDVPPTGAFGTPPRLRRVPHIYTPTEVDALLRGAAHLTPANSIRPPTYVALLSLLFSSGLRVSEALALRLDDLAGEAVVVRKTKFRKSRLVPLHPTARGGLDRYITLRQRVAARDRSVFVSLCGTGLRYPTVCATFLQIARAAGLRRGPGLPGPHLHDARHTFAVRALESCRGGGAEVARHILALSTYLGHAHPSDTYWYLQATPLLMESVAYAGETLFTGGRP
jgi:integrase